MIGGIYILFVVMIIGGWSGSILFVVVWIGVLIGVIVKLLNLCGLDWLIVFICLVFGWVVVFVVKFLIDNVLVFGFWMILVGGVLYMFGIVFYVWKNLKF